MNAAAPSPELHERGPSRPLILIPVYNDYASLEQLLRLIHAELRGAGRSADVLVVDDGSVGRPTGERLFSGHCPDGRPDPDAAGLRVGRLLELRRNLGHQRAIAVGLCFAQQHLDHPAVILMDADGEDDPADLPRLLDAYDAHGGACLVFAARGKRSESLGFRAGYQLYKLLHRVLTGHGVRVGNYSVLPRFLLDRLVVVSELWNHYAAAVVKARLPFQTVATRRGRRLAGRSSMNLVSLVIHGLSAISVFSDTVGVRLILATLGLMGVTFGGVLAVVALRLLTDWAVPGWATYTAGLLGVILLQLGAILVVFITLLLAGRHGSSFLPLRDYPLFCGLIEVAPYIAEPAAARPAGSTQPAP